MRTALRRGSGAATLPPMLFFQPRGRPSPARHTAWRSLGYNLMRIQHHDSKWVQPNIFAGAGRHDTLRLDPHSLDLLDWWIKCLKDEGIYIWLDLSYRRVFTAADGIRTGFQEITKGGGSGAGFNYFNDEVQRAMVDFQHQFLDHSNPYTKLKYKDDPGVVGVLITNENDLTSHFGNAFQPNHHNPVHTARFKADLEAFARETGLPQAQLWKTWTPGPNKIFLNAMEHRFNAAMIADLRNLGVRVPLVTTSIWGDNPISSLPSVAESDIVDTHSYGEAEALSTDPRSTPNFVSWLTFARVEGKPFSTTEWNVAAKHVDRFTAPMYVASIAALQGISAAMIFCYSQLPLIAFSASDGRTKPDPFSTFNDPRITGVMPAAALAFRRGDVSPARKKFCLMLSPDQLINQDLSPKTAAACGPSSNRASFRLDCRRSSNCPGSSRPNLRATRPS